mmetsp:Transcript_38027/g.89004  ORF Transcript_38027/g.89004 Transcript_38027/m.89004 type:complete len:334 (-) Transcript_38027:128-1129(-)
MLFPPCTGLSVVDVSQRGAKSCVQLTAQVSTARPDTTEIETPWQLPGLPTALRWLATTLKSTSVRELSEWDFSQCALEDISQLELLLGCARRELPALRAIDLSKSRKEVLSALVTPCLKQLESLTLSDCEFSEEVALELCHGLQHNTTLLTLDISINYVGHFDEFRELLGDALATNTALHTLEMRECYLVDATLLLAALRTNTALTHLDLSNNKLSAESRQDLGDVLETNGSLTTLLLSRCRLDEEDAARLLGTLCLPGCTLSTLDLTWNALGDAAEKLSAFAAERPAFELHIGDEYGDATTNHGSGHFHLRPRSRMRHSVVLARTVDKLRSQ